MNPFDSSQSPNAALAALFLRATTHAEVRTQFCAALLEAELHTLTPRGQSTRPAESVVRPQGRNLQFMRWGDDPLYAAQGYKAPAG